MSEYEVADDGREPRRRRRFTMSSRFGGRALDLLAAGFARGAGSFSRLLNRGAGSSVPGLIMVRLRPGYIERRVARLSGGVIAVSGTNGKTTTVAMIRSILESVGFNPVVNETGSNLSQGIATAFLQGGGNHRLGVFEIDEAALVRLVPVLRPRMLILSNVFRDQLDRFGEIESVASLLARAAALLPKDSIVVANADDPLLWWSVEDRSPVGFGVDTSWYSELNWDAEPDLCPQCRETLTFDSRTIAHLGRGSCDHCGWASAAPTYPVRLVADHGLSGMEITFEGRPIALGVGGIHNAYNAAAALAATHSFGIPVTDAIRALESFQPRFGRGEKLVFEGTPVWLLLIKNPAGAGVVIDAVASDPGIGAAVISINDLDADGRDVSWIWDADFEGLTDTGVPLVASGRRALDIAVRIRYANRTPVVEPNPVAALRRAVAQCGEGRAVAVLATYTAMLDFRGALSGARRRAFAASV
jgi:lipid II isoglutaminyl synthase (glutamine-hydrolysing)